MCNVKVSFINNLHIQHPSSNIYKRSTHLNIKLVYSKWWRYIYRITFFMYLYVCQMVSRWKKIFILNFAMGCKLNACICQCFNDQNQSIKLPIWFLLFQMGVILFQNFKWQMQLHFRFIFFKKKLLVHRKPNLNKTWPIKPCSKILKQLKTPNFHNGNPLGSDEAHSLALSHFVGLFWIFQPTSLAMFQFWS
jgi:hypothetical protein